jgi:hypothetical protein
MLVRDSMFTMTSTASAGCEEDEEDEDEVLKLVERSD